MSLQKQIDLIMITILKNTDKIYEENPDDNYRANCVTSGLLECLQQL